MYISLVFIRDVFAQTRCIANGAPIKPTTELSEIDWTKLLLMESNDNPFKPSVSEGDMALFFNNVTVEEINVIIPEHGQDSHFVTLAAEPATVLESSTVSDTMLPQHVPQRRQTTATRFFILNNGAIQYSVSWLFYLFSF